jgi:hypothetical protein
MDRRRFLIAATSAMAVPSLGYARYLASVETENIAAQSFIDLLKQFQQDPELAESSKTGEDEIDKTLTEGLEAVPIRTAKSATQISTKASDLIVACEVTNRQTYDARYQLPIWPALNSGITIGIGYDLGQVNPSELMEDWRAYLKGKDISGLSPACGVRGSGAAALLARLAPVKIEWDTAFAQYCSETRPRYVGATEAALANTKALTGDSLGALVSLVYNRGPSFAWSGNNYREMRAIKLLMQQQQFDKIPCQIRSMMRLWVSEPKAHGLLMRREAEASLFEAGLGL